MVELREDGREPDCDDVARISSWRAPRWVGPFFAVAAVVLAFWIVLLTWSLPSTERAENWDLAWAGFDAVLAVLLVSVAVAAWRASPRLEAAATATATLLFVDAWFDILTSQPGGDRLLAIALAVLVEIPVAVLCLLIARDTERRFLRPVQRVADSLTRTRPVRESGPV